MLEEPTVNIKDIGKSVGYEDSNYFTKVFRRITGQSPSEYRNTVFRENNLQASAWLNYNKNYGIGQNHTRIIKIYHGQNKILPL